MVKCDKPALFACPHTDGQQDLPPVVAKRFNQRRRLNLVRILLVPENRGLLADIAMNSGWVAAGDQDDIVRERQLPQVANRSPLLSFV
jgi:hypothetical protein